MRAKGMPCHFAQFHLRSVGILNIFGCAYTELSVVGKLEKI